MKYTSAALGFLLSAPLLATQSASASWHSERLVSSQWNQSSPSGKEIEIKNADLILSDLGNMGTSIRQTRIELYVWVRESVPTTIDPATQSSYLDGAFRVVDVARPDSEVVKSASWAGHDSETGYQVYRMKIHPTHGPWCGRFYVELVKKWQSEQPSYFSNQGTPDQYFNFCYNGINERRGPGNN